MPGYQLYVPHVKSHNQAKFRELGLGSIIEGVNLTPNVPPPDGAKPGCVLHWDHLVPDVTWKPVAQNKYWVGTKGKVTPASLRLQNPMEVRAVKLADDQSWTFPVLKGLPKQMGLNGETGKFERRTAPEFRDFYERGMRHGASLLEAIDQLDLWQREHGSEPYSVDVVAEEGWQFVCAGLAMQYRLTPEIIDVLELLDDHACAKCISAAIELEVVLQVVEQKKTDEPLRIPITSST